MMLITRKGLFLLALAVSASTSAFAASNTVETVSVMDLGLNRSSTHAYALRPGKTVSNKVPSLDGKSMPDAFGVAGNCVLTYDLKGESHRLSGLVGIDDSVDKTFTDSVELQVYGDNKRLWGSGPLKPGDKPIVLDVALKGVKRLELVQDFAGDHFMAMEVAWANMAITYSGNRPAAAYPSPTPAQGKPFMTPPGSETPRITGARVFGVRPGSPFLFTVTASGRKPMSFSSRNLPPELQLNPDTGQITGCLRTNGEYRVALTARNDLGASERELRIVVGDNIALVPAMGWNSWCAWLKKVDQQKMEQAAELLVSTGLKDHGYLYVNIDDGWQGTRGGKDNALQPNEKFPDMKGMCDKIHQLGLKAGIYHTPWMTSYGRYPGGTSAYPDGKWTREIDGNSHSVGPYAFLNQDARQWGEWGIDFCKWDWLLNRAPEIVAVSDSLKQSGRDMICSLSNRAVYDLGPTFVAHANSWRGANDFLGRWTFLANIAFSGDRWAKYTGPGHWPDMDMLVCGVAWGKPTGLTPDEQYVEMSMWCLMSSPILISCELERLDEFTLRLLTNDEVLDISQDPLGKAARRTLTRDLLDVWVKDLEDGSKAIGFFNRSREPLQATIDLKALGLSGKYSVRDLWKRADVGSVDQEITVSPPPHGVQLYKLTRALPVEATRSGAGVAFSSSNPLLQRVFDGITQANRKNEDRMKDGRRVLVEGDIWRGIWLETQPLGGSMYGKFDLEIARNNLEVVIDGQLANGMLPHLTHLDGTQWNGAVGFNAVAQYGLDAYYLFKKDPAFLDKLENALTRYDAFLWKTRDRNGNGVLEAYGTTDTGEDGQAGNRYDLPRDSDGKRFVESVSVTADSYANRAVLAQIAAIQGDEAKRAVWQTKADDLQKRAKEYFWIEDRKAAFDRNSQGEILPTLNQLNIRAMAQGLFNQQMAEDFVRCHLMNPEEFFTPYPIPSTAINDPKFINVEKSTEYASWAGPSQGLTLQRSVKALENYGFYVEIGQIGERLLKRIGQEPVRFPVQFNPVTGDTVARAGVYGPMVLASMEFLSRMYGVYVFREAVVWNGLPGGNLEYKQTWHQNEYRLVNRNERVSGYLNGNKLFEVPVGLRVETDYEGNVKRIAGLAPQRVSGSLLLGKSEVADFAIDPNQVRSFSQTSRSR